MPMKGCMLTPSDIGDDGGSDPGEAREGADINAIRDDGNTPIITAMHMNHINILKTLCATGAAFTWQINEQTKTILEEACQYGSIEAMDTIAATPKDLISYDFTKLQNLFNTKRNPVWAVAGEEQFRKEKTWSSFINLLGKRGVPFNLAEKGYVRVDYCTSSDEEDGMGNSFEDALDKVPCLSLSGEKDLIFL